MNSYGLARQMVMLQLDKAVANGKHVTSDLLRTYVQSTAAYLTMQDADDPVDVEELIRDIEADYNVHVGTWNSLSDDADHVPWLDSHDKDQWKFWPRYSRYLAQQQGLPTAAVKRLDEITEDILGRLEDPRRPGPWDRRGLVAGQVQSGKTGNYIGLIAKAIDAGYKLVVVLAGIHNSLRSQTQARIDEGILGFDTRSFRLANQVNDTGRIGVGKLAGSRLYVNSFTSSAQNGDFRLSVAQNMGVVPGGADPIVLVVKKNKSILTNLYKWATGLTTEPDPVTGELKVRNVPVLVIDDEADHASVNTKTSNQASDDEADPSVINGLIRQFLKTFDCTAYVAYTATPFANIFIDPDADHVRAGEDLFPRSFIINLPAPSTYTGPERVFGLREDVANSIEEVEALPIVRTMNDYEEWLPDRHKSSHTFTEDLPDSLADSIVFFLMAGAVRRLRGQASAHHSMLVHVTRFKNVQEQVFQQVQDFLEDLTDRLDYGEGAHPVLAQRVRRIYEDDLAPTTGAMQGMPDLKPLVGDLPSLNEIMGEMPAVARKTHLRLINGNSADALEYVDHPEGISVIAIGGDKLSRGLTLEGLCVSYYLRASKMYDTLMQMGRWFGYRPGYLDLCRLYTAPLLVNWYERITAASAELQREFEAMAAVGRTPADFGLRVRQHPDGLLVTSPAKLRHAQRVSISFSGSISETVTFRDADRKNNSQALERLVRHLGPNEERLTGARVWRGIAPSLILNFLNSYQADRAAFKAQPKALVDYISQRVADDELTEWTVVLADIAGKKTYPIGGLEIGLTNRSDSSSQDPKRYTIRRLVSPSHEMVELPKDSPDWEVALRNTIKSWEQNPRRKDGDTKPTQPSALWERRLRSAQMGVFLLYPLDPGEWAGNSPDATPFVGFAASFPGSPRAEPIEYQVNLVTLRQEFGWEMTDDEE